MNRTYLLAAAAVLAIGGAAFVLTGQRSADPYMALNAQTSSEDVDTSIVQEMVLGAEDAPVTIVEYASFTCPHCRTFHENVFGKLKTDYIDTGKVKFVFREVYFDRYGLWAGMVARCGGDQRYFGIVDLVFENQSKWTSGKDAQIAQNLKRFGKVAGLDDETLDACMTDADKAKAMTVVYQQNAKADGIQSTPSFVINGETHSNMSYEEMKKLIDAAS